MATGSGLAAFFGVAPETTYGTYVAPSRFYRFDEAQIKKTKNVQQGGGLAGGAYAQPGGMRVVTTTAGDGKLTIEPLTKQLGLLLAHIFGGTPTVVQQASTLAYLQTHTLGDNFGKSLSAQLGTPNVLGTVVPFSGTGGKLTSAEFSCEKGGLVKLALEFDYQGETETQTLAAPSYVAGVPFSFRDMNVKLGATYGSEASVNGVTKASIKLERSQADDRYYAGKNGLKDEPIMNDWVKVSGSFDVDFGDKTVFLDRFSNDTPTSGVLEWVSPVLAGVGNPCALRFKVPQLFFDDEPPSVDGPDIVSHTLSWTGQLDLTNPLVIAEYMSSDTAI